ncbi:DUF2171 domain-containing protein [Sphingomonas gilva]|uniref:DUF2171 domain-containing protein n=1 Tax=Sphingomonas gilva TaxID=2305907 RepID=A0A396RTI7_9SPHN|nr:DUF2171 domain-containing protein [Sphingomonas gilva]RHW19426.1 DUF2171 domain-containing protein [Sphingomonas gilva]
MGYERSPRDRYRDSDEMDYSRDYGSGRDYTYSSARDYASADWRDREDNGRFERGGYRRDGGRFDQRPHGGYGGRDYQSGQDRDREYGDYGRGRGPTQGYRPSYGRGLGYRDSDRGAPQGYDQDDRGFFARAGDEVRSWFGDEEAERRREYDARYDDRHDTHSDRDYGEWRRGQISALDRDYDEYRRENRTKFENEFTSWRSERQGQRSLLEKVSEHMEVTGSDGQHVGTVDKVRGDRIILTKNDQDAGGHHHSIPSRWLRSVDDKVIITKSADEAQREWRDEERRTALFSDDDRERGPHMLNRSFSGTYRS